MEKRLCWAAIGVAGLFFIIFLMDLIAGIPFNIRSISPTADVLSLICCILLAYLAWNALRDLD